MFYASIVLLSISSRGEVKNLYYGAFILLSLIMAFRNHMGIDDSQYEYHFDRACTLGLLEYLTSANMEKGICYFNLYYVNYLYPHFPISSIAVLLDILLMGVDVEKNECLL